jgi:hypothetical protein
LLKPTVELRSDVVVAETPPVIEFPYYGSQDHPGRPWSNWGDSLAVEGKYYSTIGDHQSPKGTAQVYEYDAQAGELRLLVDLRQFLESSGSLAPDENHTSGKIHTRIDVGRDGWLYYAGHRGSTRTTDDAHGFRGERIYRTNPQSGQTQIAAEFPIPKHVISMGVLDPNRMIFYGGTAAGPDANRQGVWFFACDVVGNRLLHEAPAWFPKAAPLPAPRGEVIRVATVDELLAAVDRIGPGGTILLAEGYYKLPRVMVLRDKKGITIRSAAGDPAQVILSGRGWDSGARGDDILHIGRCDAVTIADLTFADCRSYGIKVEAENAPKDIHIYNCRFCDIGVRAIKVRPGRTRTSAQ